MNAVNQEVKRTRRTPEEVRAARLAREADQLAKVQARAARLAEMQKKTEERAKRVEERKAQIANDVPATRQREVVDPIKEPIAKKVTRELTQFIKELGEKHGMDFSDVSPRLIEHGSALSMRFTGHMANAKRSIKNAVGATREATRFIQNHKLIGIKGSLLNKEIQLAGEEGHFKVLGLKGRAHDVVLQKVGNEDTFTVAADDFKARVVTS